MKQKDLALIFGSIAAFTIIWVGFSLWHVYTTSTIKEPLTSQLLQIPGTFDTNVIDELKKRTSLNASTQTLSPATPSAQEEPLSQLKEINTASSTPLLAPETPQTPTSSTSGGGI